MYCYRVCKRIQILFVSDINESLCCVFCGIFDSQDIFDNGSVLYSMLQMQSLFSQDMRNKKTIVFLIGITFVLSFYFTRDWSKVSGIAHFYLY